MCSSFKPNSDSMLSLEEAHTLLTGLHHPGLPPGTESDGHSSTLIIKTYAETGLHVDVDEKKNLLFCFELRSPVDAYSCYKLLNDKGVQILMPAKHRLPGSRARHFLHAWLEALTLLDPCLGNKKRRSAELHFPELLDQKKLQTHEHFLKAFLAKKRLGRYLPV